jgi:hypothetical protein
MLLSLDATCQHVDELMTLDDVRTRTGFVADVYLGCARAWENAKRYDAAVELLEQFRRDFKRHPRMDDVDATLAGILHKRALAMGAETLPPPQPSGTTSSGETAITIQNSAPEEMRLSYTGPKSGVLEVPACSECETFRGSEPEACPELGEIAELRLPPGTYNVTVEAASDGTVIPFIGSWKLEDGWVYAECYYIVTTRTF